ncbi:FISUMP domain-containing protein [Dysgonomonas sp. 25]|uniref:FISUMP domain-containing protein n=1 Tax=Dysgonomonas sp. 25 TaxID=2302933 RepID=UPI0013D3EAAD|nr:FISUMP domain-containing protein [Dysgonomonas sp. 25]NDV68691.1 hypothetical protein [Dysgonomonas sp. 25]
MKRILFTHMLLLMLLSATMTGHAQVTIGSGEKPNKGALLDLKQTNNEISSTKGVILPRVQLTDLNNLFPMFESDDNGGYKNAVKADEDKLHTGMIVFNTASSVLLPEGVYIWDGSKWTKGAEEALAKLHLSESRFDLPSGKDARTLTAQELVINWMDGASPTYNAAAASGFTAVPFTGNPLTPATLTTSPTTISLLPDAMTDTDVTAANPWKTKETELSFLYTDTDEDGNSKEKIKTVTINQTNFALKVNNSLGNTQFVYLTAAAANFDVQGNVRWVAEIADEGVLESVTPAAGGETLTDGTNTTENVVLSYTAGLSGKYILDDITFKDADTPKRFEDITVSTLSCNTSENDPSIEEWARRAGFTDDEIAAVLEDGTDSRINTDNGIQLHRDQCDSLFLSGDFGTAGRWMLHNMRATKNYNGGALSLDYPNNSVATYNKGSRMGRLYNWGAASVACPTGWSLPNATQWSTLLSELQNNHAIYGTNAKDPCPMPGTTTATGGNSNVISAKLKPGFNIMFSGSRGYSGIGGYGGSAMFRVGSASYIQSSGDFWIYGASGGYTNYAYSVRCIKN